MKRLLWLLLLGSAFGQIVNPPSGSGLPTGCTGTTGVITCTDFEGTIGVTAPQAGHFSTLDATSGITAISDGVHSGIDALIGNTTAPAIPSNVFGFIGPNSASFTSYVLRPPATAPLANNVMRVGAPASNISSLTYGSNCAAAGSAANPSLVSCTAATEGSFSCATNSSTGTCVISTTAVTANSRIFVQPSSAEGTNLSVTCNTTADTGLTAPRLTAKSAATSFTITLGTFTTNPMCFNFWIVD